MRDLLNKNTLLNAISSLDKPENKVFVLSERFKKLSLKDIGSSNSSGSILSQSYRYTDTFRYTDTLSIFDRFKLFSNSSIFTKNLMEQTKAPFIDIPKSITMLTEKSRDYVMSLGFRFLPGQEDFLSQNLHLPESNEGLKLMRKDIGLTLSKDSLSSKALLKLKGLTDLSVDKASMLSRVLVEAITYNDGYYGRFIILVKLGIGCTVWYGFAPGNGVDLPVEGLAPLFNHIDNYESFIHNPEVHVQPGFNKLTLVEGEESPIVPLSKAFLKEEPFVEIQIPNAKGTILVGVALGLTVATLFTLGIAPNID